MIPALGMCLVGSPAMAGQAVNTAQTCDTKAYNSSVVMEAPAKWVWLNLGGVNIKVPYSKDWVISDKSIKPFEREITADARYYYFGRAESSPFEECYSFRQYAMIVKNGTSYKPGFKPYEAWVEKVGDNVVTFYQATGDRDTPGSRAVLLKRGKVIVINSNYGGWDKESLAILASIK